MAPQALRSKPVLFWLSTVAWLAVGCGDGDDNDKSENAAPVAEAGGPQLLSSNAAVSLSGSGSFDPDGDPITYHWTIDTAPEGSSLLDADSPFSVNDERDPSTTFTPDAEGTFVVSLVVIDGLGAVSAPDRTTITISSGSAPVADAGDDQRGNVGDTISLDGSQSWDKLGRDLSYDWSFAQVPGTSALTGLSSATTAAPSFEPDVSGLYLVALVVDNGLELSRPDTIIVRINAGDSDAPIADAGDDIEGDDCTHIPLDGSASYDPNGEPLTYAWDLEERPDGSSAAMDAFADPSAASTSFYPDVDGEYVLSLSVHDGVGWSIPDEIKVFAAEREYNSPASVNPGSTIEYDGGEANCEATGVSGYFCGRCDSQTITLGSDALINDPDGDTVQYRWTGESGTSFIDSPNRLVTTATVSNAQPTAPDACEPNTYTFRLTATDCTGQESSQTVTHIVNCCGVLYE